MRRLVEAMPITDWDTRFLNLAHFWASECSKDPSTKVGAVLVSPDRLQVILGYNGFARGLRDDKELLQNREIKYQRTIHAEKNAILNCPIRPVGWTLYSTLFPCINCALMIIQSGIHRVVAPQDCIDRWKQEQDVSRGLFHEAGVELTEV